MSKAQVPDKHNQNKKRKVMESDDNGNDFFGVGLEAQQEFKKWWKTARQSDEPPSPYDFLVNGLGLRPKKVYDVLKDMLVDSYSPMSMYRGEGYFHYLAHHFRRRTGKAAAAAAVTTREKEFDPLYAVLQYASELIMHQDMEEEYGYRIQEEDYCFPPEQELLAVAGKTNPLNWKTILGSSLCYEFTGEFLHSLFGKVPADHEFERLYFSSWYKMTTCDSEGPRYSFDMDCVMAIQRILPKIKHFYLGVQKWRRNAFANFMSMLLQTTSLQCVSLDIPSHFMSGSNNDRDDATEYYDTSNGIHTSFLQQIPSGLPPCGIQEFKFDFDSDQDLAESSNTEAWYDESLSLVLTCIAQMPFLKVLKVGLGHLETSFAMAAPSILQAMQNPRLSKLIISGQTRYDHTSKNALVEILRALQHNTSIHTFEYEEIVIASELPLMENFQFRLYDETLLNILRKDNTSLVNLKVGFEEEANERYQECRRPASITSEKINYYINLNKHGRSAARNPETKLEDFIDLLLSVYHDDYDDDDFLINPQLLEERNQECIKLQQFNTIYGLLRELPGTWSVHASK